MAENESCKLSNFIDWLEEKPKSREYAKIMYGIAISYFIVLVLALVISMPFGGRINDTRLSPIIVNENSIPILSTSYILMNIKVATIEEFYFRLLPLITAANFSAISIYLLNRFFMTKMDMYRTAIKTALIIAIPASMYFGYLHGGYVHILMQGIGGYILSIVYIKCGGLSARCLAGWASSSALHFFMNMSVTILAVMIFGMQFYTPT
jgi:hypothetical protein